MRNATLQFLRQQYGFRCGYCGLSETDAGSTLTIDHFRPRIQGGGDDLPNLVYACHACNEHKKDYWNPNGVQRILHPLNDDLTLHLFLREDDFFEGITETGAFHIERLQLNRPALVGNRRDTRARETERGERSEMLTLLRQVVRDIASLKIAIEIKRTGGE